MCKCICVPKKSHSNKACPECFPELRKQARERVRQTFRQKKQRRAHGENLGKIMLKHEPFEPGPAGDKSENVT